MNNLTPFLLLCFLLVGCSPKKQEVHVPSRWGSIEFIKEIRYVWFVKSSEITFNGDLSIERRVVQRIWEADRDGKSLEEIDKAFETRKLQDILDNGI